jgi:hypothetical protein
MAHAVSDTSRGEQKDALLVSLLRFGARASGGLVNVHLLGLSFPLSFGYRSLRAGMQGSHISRLKMSELVAVLTPSTPTINPVMVRGAKLKKAASPPTPTPPQQDDSPADNTGSGDDAGLLDDLLAELDSRDPVVKQEAGAVITEVQLNAEPDVSALPSEKKSSKRRFKERGVWHPKSLMWVSSE